MAYSLISMKGEKKLNEMYMFMKMLRYKNFIWGKRKELFELFIRLANNTSLLAYKSIYFFFGLNFDMVLV